MHNGTRYVAAVVAQRKSRQPTTMIIFGISATEIEFEQDLREKIKEQYPDYQILNVTIVTPPQHWVEAHREGIPAIAHDP